MPVPANSLIKGIYRAYSGDPRGNPLNTTVQVSGGAGPVGPVWVNIATLTLYNLAIGDLLLCGIDEESTTPQSYNESVQTQIIAGQSIGDAQQQVIAAAVQGNTPAIHHLISARTSLFKITNPANNILTFRLAVDGGASAGASDFYTLENLNPQNLIWCIQFGSVPLYTD